MPAPQNPQIAADLRLVAQRLSAGQIPEAVRICRQILQRFPNQPQVLYALGVSLSKQGQIDQAIAAYRDAIRAKPDFFEAHTNLGTLLGNSGRGDEAMAAFTEAARLRPDVAEMHVNHSNAHREAWKLDEAIASATRAIQLKPALPEAHLCLGAALACQGKYELAIESYRLAIRARPDFAAAHLNLALSLLVTGNLQAGWPEYEWRQRTPGALPPRTSTKPRWNGQPLEGKRILLYAEQGFGDAIHFIRYAPLVAARGGKILVECPQPLARLFQTIPDIQQLVTTGQPLPDHDVEIALPSLPGVFNTTLDSIPAPTSYLAADTAIAQTWRDRIKPQPETRQIGIVWAGSAENRNDRNRSIPLDKFSPILEVKNARFHSLQITPSSSAAVSDWSKHLTDFAETAGLITNLDLVISVDTAPAHLAAAMGKPVWLLIPFPPDWRWLLNRSDSVWYPTIRLFRQPTPGNWNTPIESISASLKALTKD